MSEMVQFPARHGYWLLICAVLGRQACLPIPANLILVAAGALAHSGKLNLSGAISLSVLTFLFADLAWFEAGRRFGNRTSHFLCGLSGDAEGYVHKATAAFARRGVRTLLVSKFVVGLDAVAAPLAGAGSTHLIQFLTFDTLGAVFWCTTYAGLGYIFSDQLESVAGHIERMGAFVALAVAAGCGYYIAYKVARWKHFVRQLRLARISPEELRDKLKSGEDILIVDLQGRANNSTQPMAIPGAVRIDPRRLELYKDIEIPSAQQVVLYCGCPGEFTSARVALALRQKGVEHVRPLAGGLQAWRDRGFPVTSEFRIPASPITNR
jgi:membrane protein DedA with SNARE-associated domain/rhodanese-related sulfurtransferase